MGSASGTAPNKNERSKGMKSREKKIPPVTLCEKQKWPLVVQQTKGVNIPRARDTRLEIKMFPTAANDYRSKTAIMRAQEFNSLRINYLRKI
jgi:hypothetical protein